MLKLLSIKNRLTYTFLILLHLCTLVVTAQQSVSVRVQVNRMPDGQFPTKIYQFNTTPGLVTMTLTNLTQTTQNIYLTGKLTGDNGVLIITSKNYRPPASIELGPFATKMLNAQEASYLFDANNLVYLSGNSSIKSTVFGEQGIPEGTYQLCIRAFDAATRAPLSDEDPIGCSNIFSVSTLEPPIILNPYDQQELLTTGVQNFPLRWTTPPGAPPSTEYLVRIVEIFGQRNPYDAIYSTATPFFETTVKGSPLFLYSILQPQMQEGRSYAMMVVASSPLGNVTFRKRGQSEVVQFTYGKTIAALAGSTNNGSPNGPTLEYANHRLTGKISWAFKKTETGSHALTTGGNQLQFYQPKAYQATAAAEGEKNSNTMIRAIEASPFLAANASRSAFASQAVLTPMISMNAIAAVNADPTLLTPAVYHTSTNAQASIATYLNTPAPQLALPTDYLSGSGSTLANINYETITVDTAAERYALPGMPVTLHAIMASGNQRTILLATGTTDADGNFSLDFLDPAYAAGNGATALTLSVVTTDFENTDISIPLSVLKSNAAEISNHTLLAKTLRLFPKLIFDSVAAGNDNGYGIHLYRDVQEVQRRPWLAQEGQLGDAGKKLSNSSGSSMVEIFSDSIPASDSYKGKLKGLATLDAKGAGRIFFGGNIYVQLVPSSSDYYDRSSVVNVLNVPLPSNKIALARVEYHLTHKPSSVSGNVSLPNGEQGKIPVQGALVRVLYAQKDRAPGLDPNSLITQTAKLNSPALMVSNEAAPPAPGWANNSLSDPGITNLQLYAWGIGGTGLSSPVMIQAVSVAGSSSSNNSKVNVHAVLNPTQIAMEVNTVPDGYRAITSKADELGNYFIVLPPLVAGAAIEVEVISTPADFRKFAIQAQGYEGPKASKTLDKGQSFEADFTIKADVADLVGRVVDAEGKPLMNARINFKGNTLGSTGPDGIFQFSIYPGTHVLSLEKEGYVVKEITIDVPQLSNGKKDDTGYGLKWLTLTAQEKQLQTLARIGESQTVKNSIARGNVFSATMFGIAAPAAHVNAIATTSIPATLSSSNAATALYNNGALALAFGAAPASPGSQYEVPRRFAIDLKDVGYLNKIVGKARFRVVDETNNPISGVRITLFDSTNLTDDRGEWYYEGFGGSATITLLPPAGSVFISEQKSFILSESGVEELIVITLKKGIRISGIVNSGGKPLPGTRILLDGMDFGLITTDASGGYSVYTTPGPHTIGARKQGYVGSDKGAPGLNLINALNFDLLGSNGRNYSTLLGFSIELDEATAAGAGQEKWTGNFVKLATVDKNVFTFSGETRIPFSNVQVSFDAQGNPLPLNNIVQTDLTELPFKLFGYLPVKLTTGELIRFTRGSDGKGQLTGKVSIAFNAIQGYRGWTMNDNNVLALAAAGAATAGQITVFSSGGLQPASQSFALVPDGTANAKLYGFAVTLTNGKADKDGLEFAGMISTPELTPIKSMSIPINSFYINRALTVSGVLLQLDAIPSLEIASWKFGIDNLLFTEDGFKIGGGLNMSIPRSLLSLVGFTDLVIAKNGIFGGKFAIPDAGINILTLADLKSDDLPLTFGRVGNSNVFRVAGKALFKVNVSILDRAFKVPSFEILTNGDFTVTAPVDYKTSVGPFDFQVSNLIIHSKDNTPSITVQGTFKADLSFIKFEVADITIKPSGGGPIFSIAKVGVKIEVPVLTTTVIVGFSNDGFEGEGKLGIAGTPINATVGFKYYKHANGIELGAKFFANFPPIPIGVYVTLEGIGGGFDYVAGGPNGGFSVDVRGKISLLGTGAVAALNPVGITVESAGILRGYGDLEMASFLKKGHAEVVFNGPEKTFTVQIDVQMSPMEGLAQETIQGVLLISAKKDDEFAFLGCSTEVKLLNLINNHGEMAVAINLKNPKTHDDLTSHFFQYAPDDYMRERFSGVYLNVSSQIGVDANKAMGFDLFVASAKLWFAYGYNASLLLNFDENAYRLSFGGGFEMGIEACVAKVACVNISVGTCIHVEGGRNNTLGWNFKASATGTASLGAGIGIGDCDPGCNEISTITDGCFGGAFKICGNATVDLTFDEHNGLDFNARAGGNTTTCF